MNSNLTRLIIYFYNFTIVFAQSPPCILGSEGVYISEAYNAGVTNGATEEKHWIEIYNNGEACSLIPLSNI